MSSVTKAVLLGLATSAVLFFAVYVGYSTGYARAYCATKYQAEAAFTGWAGQNSECLISPAIPARTEQVP